jgi:hypothetical protein
MKNNLRSLRLALVAAGIAVAAPSFASTVTPLCGDDKDHGDKSKSENKKEKEPKKPTNPA